MSSSSPPLSVSDSLLLTFHCVSFFATLLGLLLHLRTRLFRNPLFSSPHIRLVLFLLSALLLFHTLGIVDTVRSNAKGCEVVVIASVFGNLMISGIAVAQTVNVHRVFLLQRPQFTPAYEMLYYAAGVILGSLVLSSLLPITLATGKSADLVAHVCEWDWMQDAPLKTTAWILGGAHLIAFMYILGVATVVSIVTNLAEVNLNAVKTKNELMAMTNYRTSRKASNMMVSEQEMRGAHEAPSWVESVSVTAGRMEDKATLAKVRHISLYPMILAFLCVFPSVLQVVLDTIMIGKKGDLSPLIVADTILEGIPSFCGVAVFLVWCMDPVLWSVLAVEREKLAKQYVTEERMALDRNQRFGLFTQLRRAWERLVWLRSVDIRNAEAEAKRQFFEHRADPELPEESVNDFDDDDNDSVDSLMGAPDDEPPPPPPPPPSRVLPGRGRKPSLSIPGGGVLRRGSTAHIQRDRKQSLTPQTPIGMRRPSVAPANIMSLPRVGGGSMVPHLLMDEDDGSGLMAGRRPSSRPPLMNTPSYSRQQAVGLPAPVFMKHVQPSVSSPLSRGRKGSVTQHVSLDSDEDEVELEHGLTPMDRHRRASDAL